MKGKLLVAKPFLDDENFERSVVLLCEYSQEGAFGLILNKETELVFSDLFENVKINFKINEGGPVGGNTLHYLHTKANINGAKEVFPGVYWSGDFDEIQNGIKSGFIQKEEIKFYLGYSGWDTNQLDYELKENTWIIAPPKHEFIFEMEQKTLWSKVLRSLGKEYFIMANTPRDSRLN